MAHTLQSGQVFPRGGRKFSAHQRIGNFFRKQQLTDGRHQGALSAQRTFSNANDPVGGAQLWP